MSTQTKENAVATELIVSQISRRINDGLVDPQNLFALTGQLMEVAQTHHLSGRKKKQAVIDAFDRLTDTNPKTQTFIEEVMPLLIDTIKMVSRGGLKLAIQTNCCGLLSA